MKRAKILLAVCFVIIVVVILSRDDGLIRTMFSGADTKAIAGPQESTPEAETAGEPEASASAAEDGDAKARSEEADDAPASDTGDPNATTSLAGGGFDYAQGGDEAFLDGLFTDEPAETSSDPNQPGDSGSAFDFGGSVDGDIFSVDADIFDELFEEEPLESINLNNVEMKNIIQTLGEWTGKPIIPTDDEVMKTRITIYATKKVPRSQALALILAALKAKGVIAEQSDDKIFLKPIATAKYGTVPTLPADEPLARMTDKSQIVEKFFQLENYSPTKLMSIIMPLTAEYGHVTAMEDTGMIVVIDTVDNLIRIERIIKQLDVPESEQMVEKKFEIEFGDPLEIVQVLEFILNTEDRYRTKSPGGSKPSGSKTGAGSVIVQQSDIPVRLIPIPKQNWIIARASSDVMDQITKWIEELDRAETVQSEQTIIQVDYADVRELENALDDMIRQMPEQIRANVIIEPLTNARQLIVFGSAENRKMIERLVAEMDMPKRDIYVQKTFKLKHADPDQIKENIDGLYGDSAMNSRSGYGGYGYNPYSRYGRGGSSNQDENVVKAISYPTQGQVTVIASQKNMTKIEKQILEEWDIPLDIEKDQYRILTLRNSDPVQLSALLTKLFSEDSSSTSNLIRMIFGGRRGDTQKKIVGSLYGMLTFEPVPDTKKIIVISKIPEAYEVIEKLIKELDSQEKAEVPTVITLNYADAEDLCDQLNAILNEPGTQATLRRSSRGLSDLQSDGSGGATSAGASGADTNTGEITPWWTRQRSLVGEEMPTSNLIGRVRFIPVARSKAILVLAPPEYLEDIKGMIAELDKPGMQVMIKVIIVEVNHSSMTSLGVQLATGSNGGALAENAANILSAFDYTGTIGSVNLLTGTDINTLIDLLVKKINAKILNQPTLWTKDNEEAVFIKGRKVAFIENAQGDSSNPAIINEAFGYKDVGLTLRVRPNITPEKAVDMTINLIISQVEPDQVNGQLATSNLDTTTHLIINNGQTVLLGGILFQNDSTVKRKIPLLGDIPVVGNLFRHTETELTNNELLVFVTPYVIDDNSLNVLPVDTDTDAQLQEPFRKMEEIRRQLDKAMDWLATEIDEHDYTDDTNKDESQTDDAVIEIRTNESEK